MHYKFYTQGCMWVLFFLRYSSWVTDEGDLTYWPLPR